MCLIFISFKQRSDWPLIIASNRDEFFNRPTEPAHFWATHSNLLAGRDQEQGGTWLACTKGGRFASVTNYRDPNQPTGPKSRGDLVLDFVAGQAEPDGYLSNLRGSEYNGYNLMVGSPQELWYSSNRGPLSQPLAPGLYGLSNHLLDTPWPKVETGKSGFAQICGERDIDTEALFELMADSSEADPSKIPQTGLAPTIEAKLSPRFIPAHHLASNQDMGPYGTRTTTIVMLDGRGHGRWLERNHSIAAVNTSDTRQFEW